MFNRPTVFVIGPGCSMEFGFPSGEGLRQAIVRRLNNEDPLLSDALARSGVPGGNVDVVKRFRRFAQGLSVTETIDQFLDLRQNDEADRMLGKLAISHEIAQAERQSGISDDKLTQGFSSKLEGAWMVRLFRRLMSNIGPENVGSAFGNITFICFNYDR